jgi:hypothetical protein
MGRSEPQLLLGVVLFSGGCRDKRDNDGSSDTECFVGETLVSTPAGPTRIDQLRPGDPVWSWDRDTDEPVVRHIQALLPSDATELTMVPTDQGWISGVTATHPFAVEDRRQWVGVAMLRPGDRLVGVAGAATVLGRPMRVRTAARAVYDLSVAGPEHNFVAGGWLVHNKTEIFIDDDGDGYYVDMGAPNLDCDDADPTVHPGATEVCDDAVDNDCDDLTDLDDPDCRAGDTGAGAARP